MVYNIKAHFLLIPITNQLPYLTGAKQVFNQLGLAMYSLAAASRPRMSEPEPKWFMFETSSYSFGRQICRLAKINVNKVNIILLYRIYSSCKLFF